MQQISKSRSKLLALGILLIVVIVFFFLLVEPYVHALHGSRERVEDLAFQIDRSKNIIAKKEFYHAQMEDFSLLNASNEIYLKSDKPALANAEIQKILKSIANKSGAELISSQSATGDLADKGRVTLRVRARADIFGLQKLIYGLESSSPNLFINEITINRGGRSVFRFSDNESTNQSLDITMQVFGYINNR